MNKRARERARQERQEAKQEKRESRADEPSPEAVDETALMAEFARLSERYSAKQITEGEYAEERRRIFEELGIASED
ncbi:hypothetical protein BH23ACT5_BH23ACT5_20010 [soil metagenome]